MYDSVIPYDVTRSDIVRLALAVYKMYITCMICCYIRIINYNNHNCYVYYYVCVCVYVYIYIYIHVLVLLLLLLQFVIHYIFVYHVLHTTIWFYSCYVLSSLSLLYIILAVLTLS